MKEKEIYIIIRTSIFLAVILALLYLLINKIEMNFKNAFRAFSMSSTVIILFWGMYFKWGWKWAIFNKIFYRPNLNGTWKGKLVSDWKDEEGNGVKPLDFYLVIRQNFLRINFTTYTSNYIGKSYSEQILLDKERGIKNIAYLYRKETSQKSKNNDEGATELRLIESESFKLKGKYWSSIKTNGEVDVSFLVRKHLDSYEDAVNFISKRNE